MRTTPVTIEATRPDVLALALDEQDDDEPGTDADAELRAEESEAHPAVGAPGHGATCLHGRQ